MAYSQSTLVSKIRRILNDNPFVDICTEDMDSSETGLDVADTTLYAVGGIVEFQDTSGEQCLITALPTATTLTVSRGYNGTTAAAHNINTQIVTNPLIQYIQVTDAVSACIKGLWPYTYRRTTDAVVPVLNTKWYNVTSPAAITLSAISNAATAVGTTTTAHGFSVGEAVTIAGTNVSTYHASWVVTAVGSATTFSFYVGTALGAATGGTVTSMTGAVPMEISQVAQVTTSTPASVFYYGVSRNAYPCDLMFNVPTAIAASGTAYYIPHLRNTTNNIIVTAIARVTDSVASGSYTDLEDGIQTDCVAYYAVARLIAALDISRTTQEDIGMGDQTVTPTTRTRIAGYWEQRALEERHKWQMELDITLPRRRKWGHR